MAVIKIKYFNARGRAECLRWILEYAGAKYEDVRIERDSWPQEKLKMLTGMVPEMEYDGFVLGETNAIASFLGKELNLAGKNSKDAARCEMVINMIGDFITKGGKIRFEQDEERKKVMKAEFEEKTIPQFIGTIMKLLTVNGGKYLIGNGVTYADICVACLLESMISIDASAAAKMPPPIEGLRKMIMESPKIKAWIDKRPSTPF